MENILTKNQIALFSGRFNVPHPGHFASIIRLADQFGRVKVVILDYPERTTTIDYALKVFKEIFDHNKLNVSFHVSPIHFGFITRDEIEKFRPFDIYASGNMSVLVHVESIGIKTHYIERAYNYRASLMEIDDS